MMLKVAKQGVKLRVRHFAILRPLRAAQPPFGRRHLDAADRHRVARLPAHLTPRPAPLAHAFDTGRFYAIAARAACNLGEDSGDAGHAPCYRTWFTLFGNLKWKAVPAGGRLSKSTTPPRYRSPKSFML